MGRTPEEVTFEAGEQWKVQVVVKWIRQLTLRVIMDCETGIYQQNNLSCGLLRLHGENPLPARFLTHIWKPYHVHVLFLSQRRANYRLPLDLSRRRATICLLINRNANWLPFLMENIQLRCSMTTYLIQCMYQTSGNDDNAVRGQPGVFVAVKPLHSH